MNLGLVLFVDKLSSSEKQFPVTIKGAVFLGLQSKSYRLIVHNRSKIDLSGKEAV